MIARICPSSYRAQLIAPNSAVMMTANPRCNRTEASISIAMSNPPALNLKADDAALRQVLAAARVIAVVGHSDKPSRTSYQIAQFLRQVGYTVYPVNPALQTIEGQPCYASLQDVPEPIDIVNVFRRSEFLPDVMQAAIAVQAKTVWAQLGVAHEAAAQAALEAGLNVIQDACIKVEWLRLRPNSSALT